MESGEGIMLFDFSSLFAEYNRVFQYLPKTESYRDFENGGQMVKGDFLNSLDMEGIILPLSDDDLKFDAAGTYTKQDRKLYLQEPGMLEENAHVSVDDLIYRVMGEKPYGHYAGFNVYFLKRTTIGDVKK